MKILFYVSLIMLFYVYFGYPIIIWIIGSVNKKKVKKDDCFFPFVSIVISAFNEEYGIEKTIRNKLDLDYPTDKFEIIIVSDESTDKTEEIVKKLINNKIKLIRQTPRAGKTSALNLAVPMAKGDIIVFSDANSIYKEDALKKLVRNFDDPQVGYVTGKMIYTNPDGSAIGDGCSTYMKYENLLRLLETNAGSVVGVDGGIDAVRKKLYDPMNYDQLPDFVLPLKVVNQGYRVVYEPEAILKESVLSQSSDEYRMRVRVSLRALWALSDMRHMLSFSKNILFSLQLWSHKALRYLCFLFLITAYVSNLFLINEFNMGYLFVFFFQNLFYFFAYISILFANKIYNIKIIYLCHYFILLNIAAAHAFIKFILREKQFIWAPRKG